MRLYPFGSCKLGVHTSASDLDMLCVGARHVTQGDFFVDLVEFLRTEAEVSALNCVADAHVPVIKLRIGGIPVRIRAPHAARTHSRGECRWTCSMRACRCRVCRRVPI